MFLASSKFSSFLPSFPYPIFTLLSMDSIVFHVIADPDHGLRHSSMFCTAVLSRTTISYTRFHSF